MSFLLAEKIPMLFVIGGLGAGTTISHLMAKASRIYGGGDAKNPRLILGKGPSGIELYAKLEQSIPTLIEKVKGNQWKPLTLWWGGHQLTSKHQLRHLEGGNNYYLVKEDNSKGRGWYQIDDSRNWASIRDLDSKFKSGNYRHIALERNKWIRNNGGKWNSFGGDSCRYQGQGNNSSNSNWGLKILCRQFTRDWGTSGSGGRRGAGTTGTYQTMTLNKDDYELN